MLKLHVSGMSCGHCEKAVEQAVADVPGVDRIVRVSHADEAVVVEGEVDAERVIEAIGEEGYTARVA
mgnify:CR=1 FL=1